MAGKRTNTLEYDAELCNRCGTCTAVCPHGVFDRPDGVARLVDPDSCMECGACQLNCAAGAIKVDSNVGCATAMMAAALLGRFTKAGPTCCSSG